MVRWSAALCVAALAGVPAAAADESATKHAAPADQGSSLPQAGDFQLFLEPPPILNATNLSPGLVTRGVAVSTGNGQTSVSAGVNAGFGYCISDIFEVGGAVAIDYGAGSLSQPGQPVFEFGFEPFLKLNFGRQLQGSLHFNPFAQVGFIAGAIAGNNGGMSLFGVDLDLGAEFIISRGWGVTAFIPISLFIPGDGSGATFGFGFGYGLVTYF